MPNENALKGIACPKCNKNDNFRIEATAFFDVTDDGTGDYTNVEWTPASFIECSSCQHAGTINDFTTSSPT